MKLGIRTAAALVAVTFVFGFGAHARAAGEAKPGVDWPQFRGIRATGVAEGFALPAVVGRRQGTERGLEDGHPWPRALRARSSGAISRASARRSAVRRTPASRSGCTATSGRLLDDTEHEWRIYCLDKKTGAVRWQQTRAEGRPEDQAAHQGVAREFHAGHRRRTPDRVLRIGRPLRLRPEGQAAVEEGSRRARRRMVHRPVGAVGNGQLADPSRQRRRRSRPTCRRARSSARSMRATASELWRVSRSDVPTWGTPTVHQVNGQTQLIVNGWRHIGAYDFKTGKEIWKLTGGGDIPVPTPVVSGRPDLHHQRARTEIAGLCHPRNGHWRHHACGRRVRATPASPGARRATAATCARRSSTGAWCTS